MLSQHVVQLGGAAVHCSNMPPVGPALLAAS
jgi:hypothetical protein